MPEIRATLTLEVDGQRLPGMPIVRSLDLAEAAELGNLIAPAGGSSFTPIAAAPASLSALLLQTDQSLNLELPALTLNAGGLLLIIGTTLAATSVQYQNPSGGTNANLKGLVGGT